MNDYRIRFKDIIPEEITTQEISIVGTGAIGSWLCLSLIKMGFKNITVYDFDIVTAENIGVQFFPIKDIGKPKVESLAQMCLDFSGISIKTVNSRFENNCNFFGHIVVMAVDSMAVRKLIWDTCKEQGARLIIDSRMGAEYANIYVRKTSESDSYMKSWYPDNEANAERCTAKATTYTVNFISGFICKIVKDFLLGQKYTRTINFNIAQNAIIIHQ